MPNLEAYLKNPCSALSIPYWKAKGMVLPEHIRIVHNSEYTSTLLSDYADDPYFRLFHPLKNIDTYIPDWLDFKIAEPGDMETVASIINRSYTDLSVNPEQMLSYTHTPVYDPALWLIALEKSTGMPVGCGIADLDREIKEGILEWIQVLPEYRSKGVGSAIVNQLLRKLAVNAEFATVSGRVNNLTNPEKLYRRCGFVGNDIWHILQKK